VPQQRCAMRMTLDSELFDGVLAVLDADLLRPALLAGVGPAKALGLGPAFMGAYLTADVAQAWRCEGSCGLLLVRPPIG